MQKILNYTLRNGLFMTVLRFTFYASVRAAFTAKIMYVCLLELVSQLKREVNCSRPNRDYLTYILRYCIAIALP